MKKFYIMALASILCANSVVPCFANSTKDEIPAIVSSRDITNVEPYAFREERTARPVIRGEASRKEGIANANAIAGFIAITAPDPFISAAGAIGVVIFSRIGATDKEVHFTYKATEYYVYDFEGNIIAYKYYLDTTAEVEGGKKTTYTTTKESTAPLRIKDLEIM